MSRTSKALISAIAVGLLAGSAVGAAAQEEATDPMSPAWVTGTIALSPLSCSNGATETVGTEGLLRRERGYRCGGMTWDSSDVRLGGEGVSTWDVDVYSVEEGPISVRTGGYEVRDGSGGWSCRHSGVAQGAGLRVKPASGETLMCVGDGGYEGPSAVLELDWTSRQPVTFQGAIFPGSLPSSPSE